MSNDTQKHIERGVRAHQRGRLQDALASYRKALKKAPDDAEALSLYGLALLHAGRVDEAGRPLRRAVAAEPGQIGFRFNLMAYWEKTGQLERAASEARAVIERDRHQPRAWEKCGDFTLALKRPGEALEAYRTALSLQPDSLACAVKMARAAIAAGDVAVAEQAWRTAVAQDAGHIAVQRLELDLLMARRDWPTLETRARTLADTHADDAAPWYALARAAFERGRFRQSAEAYREVLKRVPEQAATLAAYARICLHASELEAAVTALERAENLAPELPEMLAAKGLLLTYLGRFDDAERYTRRCLRADPGYAPAYTQLVELTRGNLDDAELMQLEKLAESADVPVEHRITAAFACANGHDTRNDVEAAFAGLQRAHTLALDRDRAEGTGYDPAATETRMDTIMSLFDTVSDAPAAPDGPVPIFVVGMPRSGTTLVESLLSAHSRVAGGGERTMMQQLLEACLDQRKLPDATLSQSWQAAYHREMPELGRADHVTDKHPLNFLAIGLIHRLFPSSPIIHIRRDPIETAFSIFHHEFTKFWTFAHRLEDIGHYYGQYARLMAFWERRLPDRVFTLQYEEVAGNFDAIAPRLVDVCGLEWEPACASFQDASRPITTLSAVQAREPVTLRIGKSTRYRHHLGPLLDALDQAGVDRRTGALRAP